jgi:UDPglucose--hexose-1-phosphate uridylyltransferase
MSFILQVYRDRMEDLGGDDRFKYVLIFKNQGYLAGATLSHAHSQLIATPVTPKRVKEELTGALRYYDFKTRCVFCDMIRQETLLTRERLVYENADFAVIAPFAARFPYEAWVLPKAHSCDYITITPAQRTQMADALQQTLRAIRDALGDPALNYLIHTAPFRRPRSGYWTSIQHDFHWHMEILPRMLRPAGFEEGSGFYINPIAPETAAETLRGAIANLRQS